MTLPSTKLKFKVRSAFTLIELAIVLVIVGLIAGGVLVGRDLIQASEIRGFLNTMNKYNTAAATFRTKYRHLPGDIHAFSAANYNMTLRTGAPGRGDGNGVIEGCSTGSMALGCETALFWRDLSDAGLASYQLTSGSDSLVNGTAPGFNINTYLPPGGFRDSIYYFVYPIAGRNIYYVARIPPGGVDNAGVVTPTAGLTPSEARAIDEKLDDGLPAVGIVLAMSDLLTVDAGNAPAANVCVDNTPIAPEPDTYNSGVDYIDTVGCQLSIRNGL